jgi:DNA-binding HxlR family transcriptional regulator
MPLGTDYARQDCSMAKALEIIGERWTLLILRDAFWGVRRFSDFQAHLDISRAVLSARLDALVADGLLRRTGGGHAEYHLTDEGLTLWPVLYALGQWGEQRTTPGRPRRVFRHAGCGRLGSDGRCEGCGTSPAPAELEIHPGPGADFSVRDDPVSVALREPHRLLTPLPPR